MCLAKEGAVYRTIAQIFREVKLNFNAEDEIIKKYCECRLLVIDEVGKQNFTPFEMNLLFEIIDGRWNNMLFTTLVTEMKVEEFAGAYSNAILDRLRPKIIEFNWKSYRGNV